jgi:membrane protease YdiL (CAAX protease family)
VSSFGEEVIYRAFIINRVAEMGAGARRAWWAAVAVSAVVFGLVHFDWGPMGIVQTAFMGLALGIAYLRVRRRLWVLILAHAYMDTILLVQMYLARA